MEQLLNFNSSINRANNDGANTLYLTQLPALKLEESFKNNS